MRRYFYTFIIDEIRDETADAYTVFFFAPDAEAFEYLPGQYLTLRLHIEGEEYRRAYSMSSSPATDDRLSVTIKRVEGGIVSNYIRDHLEAGDVLEIMPPMGHFVVRTHPELKRHYILIGAGSGITPLMSILKTVLAAEPDSKVSLWYGNRNEDSIIFKEELNRLIKKHPQRFHLAHFLSQASEDWKGFRGRLDKTNVYNMISELFMRDEYRKQYYICGPLHMMNEAEAALDKHAVNPPDIFRELYTAPVPSEADLDKLYSENEEGIKVVSDGEEEYPIVEQKIILTLNGKSHNLTVKPDEHILDAALNAGLDVPYTCRSGICTTCRAMLDSGLVSMDETAGLSEEELENGYILSCQAHPLTDDVEVDFD